MERIDMENLVVNRLFCPREDRGTCGRPRYFRQVSIGLDYAESTSAGSQPSWTRMYITQPPSFKKAELAITPTRSSPSLRLDVLCLLAAHNENGSIHDEFHDCAALDITASLGDVIDATYRAADAAKLSWKEHGGVFTICSPEGIEWKSSSLSINGRIKDRRHEEIDLSSFVRPSNFRACP